MKTHAMELIFFPLFILIIMGVFANNFASSSLQIVPSSFACSDSEVGVCRPTSAVGCDSSPSACTISSSTSFSFLNPASPFTALVQGNIVGFFTLVLNNGEQNNAYTTAYTLCIPMDRSGNLINESGAGIQNLQCYGAVSNNGAGNVFNPLIIPVINASSPSGNASVWTLEGCPNSNHFPPCGINYVGANATWQTITENAFYLKNGTQLTSGQCTVLGVTYSVCGTFWKTFFSGGTVTFICPSTSALHAFGTGKTIYISATTYYCLLPYDVSSSANLGASFGFWGFLGGLFLVIIGMGLTFGAEVVGSGFSFGSNEQGAKQATVAGIAIMVWSFAFSEFGSVLVNAFTFSSFGLYLTIALTAVFFMGVYWRFYSLE
jgi:hypothetical protein